MSSTAFILKIIEWSNACVFLFTSFNKLYGPINFVELNLFNKILLIIIYLKNTAIKSNKIPFSCYKYS